MQRVYYRDKFIWRLCTLICLVVCIFLVFFLISPCIVCWSTLPNCNEIFCILRMCALEQPNPLETADSQNQTKQQATAAVWCNAYKWEDGRSQREINQLYRVTVDHLPADAVWQSDMFCQRQIVWIRKKKQQLVASTKFQRKSNRQQTHIRTPFGIHNAMKYS